MDTKRSIMDFHDSLAIHSMSLETIIFLLDKAYDSNATLKPTQVCGLTMLLKAWLEGYMKILDQMDGKANL